MTTAKIEVPAHPDGAKRVVCAVDYLLDAGKPLLVAFDFTGGDNPPPSSVGFVASSAVGGNAVGHFREATQGAAKPDRTGSAPANPPSTYLIEKIEVG